LLYPGNWAAPPEETCNAGVALSSIFRYKIYQNKIIKGYETMKITEELRANDLFNNEEIDYLIEVFGAYDHSDFVFDFVG
jgi:hypothetical protein